MIYTVTHLYGPISGPCDKPLIPRLHSDGPHPAEVTADDLSHKNMLLLEITQIHIY